jgi:hypothetical protein
MPGESMSIIVTLSLVQIDRDTVVIVSRPRASNIENRA